MPIRLNLLAEQQAAEEMRRRDPVKRAIWAGSFLVALVLLWCLSLQFQVQIAKKEMAGLETRLKAKEEEAKQAKNDQKLYLDIIAKTNVLEKYAANRFLWGTALDALQYTIVTNVRLVRLEPTQRYFTNAETLLLKTDLVFKVQPPKGWKFWKTDPPKTNVLTLVTNQFMTLITNYPFTTNRVPLFNKITKMTTNEAKTEIKAEFQILVPAIGVEQSSLKISARDYSPSGKQVDEFMKAMANSAYFKATLKKTEGQGIQLLERPTQPEPDMEDPLNPSVVFFPFTIQCQYEDKVLSNE